MQNFAKTLPGKPVTPDAVAGDTMDNVKAVFQHREGSVADVLQVIWSSGWPIAERRRLAARAVASELALARRSAAAAYAVAGGAAAAAVTLLEESLVAVGRLAGLPPGRRLPIVEAKAFLRSAHGPSGCALAASISRL